MTGGRAGRQALRRRLEELTHDGEEEDAGTLFKALITFLMKKSVV
jgi:hypothetical protein